ncbi:MAG: hypothetical protein N4J56_006454 [Chroococcidiopsis sp. SAG 2025]|uniref:hypothetical protein n=1 Tax=Chroococcidiopsis sp. SAG 2025 TaxID=171389 RepID=UPI002936F0CC|nr:hypothetical protein [Chroococcidiopsis sp. SAG 2025]MDV2996749.1 hypothetical protein [Chroococcidiopsis sp. SAG 2025]
MLQQYLEQRLQTLQSEFEAGQTMLAELEAKQANLQKMLLRISGAIQVLEECLNEAKQDRPESSLASDTPAESLEANDAS